MTKDMKPVEDPFGLVDETTAPAETKVEPGVTEHKNRQPVGSTAETTHERFKREMSSGEEAVTKSREFLNRRNNPYEFVYEVEYWLSGTDANEYDEALAENREPKKQPLRTQFTHNTRTGDSDEIGDLWWKSVSHKGVTHFVNENVRNTKPFRVTGKFVAKNPYYVKPKKQSDEEKSAALELRKTREKQLSQFKKHGTLDRIVDRPAVSNQIVPSN